MSFNTVNGIPITIDLVTQANSTGWSINGTLATHESCNEGSLLATDLTLFSGTDYVITYQVISISGGTVSASIGNTEGTIVSSPGFYTDTLEATGDLKLRLTSDANCVIQLLSIQAITAVVNNRTSLTLAFSERGGKWTSFYDYLPDTGVSLFVNLYTFKNGLTYLHDPNNASRSNIYGSTRTPSIKATFNEAPGVVKMFQSINMNSGCLIVTGTDGIVTSIGQVSELADIDFLQSTLVDGPTEIKLYDKDGIYLARFLRDMSTGNLYDGDLLRGNYITIDLAASDPDTLKLISISVKSVPSIMNVK